MKKTIQTIRIANYWLAIASACDDAGYPDVANYVRLCTNRYIEGIFVDGFSPFSDDLNTGFVWVKTPCGDNFNDCNRLLSRTGVYRSLCGLFIEAQKDLR